jgi:serine/threonine-protein kinase
MLPGGDPLEAAIRAGETPSPAMVAAAGEEGSLSSAKAWGLFGLTLLAVGAAIFFAARVTGLDTVPMPRSPDALRDRAREIALQLGDEVPPRHDEWWVSVNRGYADAVREHREAPSLADARPSAIRFTYRQSPRSLLPRGSNQPSRTNPVPSWYGEALVALDPQGRLLEFSRTDRQLAPADSTPTPPVDWRPLLAFTGADAGALRSVPALWTPDVACDARAAWVWNGGGTPVRLEAASWRGKPVWFRTVAPWERAERDAARPSPVDAGFTVFIVFVCVTIVVIGALARHNLLLGRSDTRGAFRVAAAVFLAFGLNDMLSYRWALEPFRVWDWMVHMPYFPALVSWLYYLGIEPFLRRRWPHRLVAWARLLEGRFMDPLVGREILLGCLAGAGIALASWAPTVLRGGQDLDSLAPMLPIGRDADFWGGLPGALGDGTMKGLGAFALVLLLRVIFRRDAVGWLGLGLAWTLASLASWTVSPIQWISAAAGAASFVGAARVGVLAAVASMATFNLIGYASAMTLDFSRWYAWRTGVVAAVLLAMALWGFRAVMGRRRILSDAMLEG